MKLAAILPLLALGLVLSACGSDEKKDDPKPAKKTAFLKLDIQSSIKRTIAIDPEGNVTDTVNTTKGKLAAAELQSLVDLSKKIDWTKIPVEYKTADGKPVPDGRNYTLLYSTPTPPRTVTSMDGAVGVDPDFAKLLDTIEALGNKIGK
jgi:hypothetical protein